MDIIVIGLNHKTASVDIREKVAFEGTRLEEASGALKTSPDIKENLILSTCNRVEIYAGVSNETEGIERIKSFLCSFHNIPRSSLDKSLYVLSGAEAVRHIFRVASSLDSMIVGEPQILGQIKDAYNFALQYKATGIFLNRLMKKTVSVAKRVRTETKIAENAVSISFAAVELAKKIFEDLSSKSFLLIGAGEMAELAAKHLISSGVKDVLVTNRTHERAEELANEFNGRVVPFENFTDALLHSDIVICSTGASRYILEKEQMHTTMKERKHRPMFLIDISVPRNLDPGINDLDNVYLYDIDDLQGVVNINIKERNREAQKAEKIIDSEVASFLKWQSSLSTFPTIVALRDHAEAIRKEELEKTLRKLGPIEEEKIKAIEYLTSSIVNKILHSPTAVLKSAENDQEAMLDMIQRLFNLNAERNNHEEK